MVTEVGRQPWIIYGLRRTEDSLTDSPLVGAMFVVFTLLYIGLAIVTVVALRSELTLQPRSARTTSGSEGGASAERELVAH